MRKKIVAGNWKMNKSLPEAAQLVQEFINLLNSDISILTKQNTEIIVSPPSPYLLVIKELINDVPKMKLASQNCHSEEKGAYTGEISANMLASCGVDYVIIGHSERRTLFNESNAFLALKVNAVLKNNLIPIFCCGELLQERNEKQHFNILRQQIFESLFNLSPADFQKVVIAYEPVWAIGTGLTATPEQAQEMHQFIRNLIVEKYGFEIANNTTILYGGSCNAKNASELFVKPDVDGGLIGGASLVATDFIQIVRSLP